MHRSRSLCSRRVVELLLFTPMAAASPPCPGDLDGSRAVDFGDVALALLDFGPCAGCVSDMDATGVVDFGDVALVLLQFGPCPSWYTVLEQNPSATVIYTPGLRAAITATGLPWRVQDNATGIEMVLIPPGSYRRGCSASNFSACRPDESPVHQVTLTRAFYISRYEVTQAQWQSKMGGNPSAFTTASSAVPAPQVSRRPVERVSWNDAQAFCAATGFRLPSEAEWEFAYRAGTTTAFHGWPATPNGTSLDSQLGSIAWFDSNSGGQTRPVGGKAANGFGLYDMSGNVGEWVSDWYGAYPSATQIDPTGPGTGEFRVWRGDGWQGIPEDGDCRSSDRGFEPPMVSFDDLGFRVAKTP